MGGHAASTGPLNALSKDVCAPNCFIKGFFSPNCFIKGCLCPELFHQRLLLPELFHQRMFVPRTASSKAPSPLNVSSKDVCAPNCFIKGSFSPKCFIKGCLWTESRAENYKKIPPPVHIGDHSKMKLHCAEVASCGGTRKSWMEVSKISRVLAPGPSPV